jgi:ABC-type branched-subunit amino acid transport system permease subunit
LVYVWLDSTTRDIGTDSDGILGKIFGWADQSPATFILGALLVIIMFLAPYGLVGLIKRAARRVVVVVPRPTGTSLKT